MHRLAEIVRKLLFALIVGYQRIISPLFGPTCRFHPTCSAYALQAIEKYGIFRGGCRAVVRLFKCHPYHPGGYDPV